MSANICNICGANLIYKDGKWVCPACGAYRTEEISNEEVTLYIMPRKNYVLQVSTMQKKRIEILLRSIPKIPKHIGDLFYRNMVLNMKMITTAKSYRHVTLLVSKVF